MSFKSLGQTFILLLCVLAIYWLDLSALLPYVLWISLIGTILILGYALYYTKNWGKPLFIFLLGAFLWAMPASAQLAQEKVQEIIAARDLCSANKVGDSYDSKMRDKAYYILSLSETLKETDLSSAAKDVLVCARQYTAFASSIDSSKINVCPTMADYMNRSASDCWICGVGFLLIESVQHLASYTEPYVKKLALQLIAILFLFWILVKVLMLFGTWGYANISEFFSDLFVRFFAVMVAVAFLYAPVKEVFSLTVSPLINMSAGLGIYMTDLTFGQSEGESFAAKAEQKFGISNETICPYCERMKDPNYSFTRADTTYTPVFEDSAVNAMLCLTCKVYRQVAPFLAMGQTFMCYSTYKEARTWSLPYILDLTIPHVKMLVFGIILVVLFGIFLFLASFNMIDAFFRLGLVALFLPIFIVTFAFPISRHYTVKAFSIVVYSILQLVGLAIAIALLLNLFLGFIPDSDTLIAYMLTNDVSEMLNVLTGEGSFYMILVLAGILIMGMQIISGSNGIVSALSGIQDPGSYGAATAKGAMQGAIKTGVAVTGVTIGSAANITGNIANQKEKDAKDKEKTAEDKEKKTEEAEKKAKNSEKRAKEAEKKAAALNATPKDKEKAEKAREQANKDKEEVKKAREEANKAKEEARKAKGEAQKARKRADVFGKINKLTSKYTGQNSKTDQAKRNEIKAKLNEIEEKKKLSVAIEEEKQNQSSDAQTKAEDSASTSGIQEEITDNTSSKNEGDNQSEEKKDEASASTSSEASIQSTSEQSTGSSRPDDPNMDWAKNEKDAYAQEESPIDSGDLTKQ